MGERKNASEVKYNIVHNMPAPLGELFYELYKQVVWLHLKWKEFHLLYCESKQTVELLNQTAPVFFHDLQHKMWDEILLHISRITDKPKVMGKDTLTLKRFVTHIPDDELRKNVNQCIDEIIDKAKDVRSTRNRRLAHCELPAVLNDQGYVEPFPAICARDLTDILSAMSKALNLIEEKYLDGQTAFSESIPSHHGALSLVAYLKKGLEAFQSERTKMHT